MKFIDFSYVFKRKQQQTKDTRFLFHLINLDLLRGFYTKFFYLYLGSLMLLYLLADLKN